MASPRPPRVPQSPVSAPPAAPGAATTGTPVNSFSRAVSPRLQYPMHFDFLMKEFFSQGLVPEKWLVIAAEEARLDEDGMDVIFTLSEHDSNSVRRCRIDVQRGKLVRISHT
jgi:hypothetical protein